MMAKLPALQLQNRKFNFILEAQGHKQTKKIPSFAKENIITTSGCYDTSARFFLRKDSVNCYIGSFVKSADGNLLLSGEYSDLHGQNYINKGLLIKCDVYGNVFWAKVYDSTTQIVNGDLYYYKLLELQDGSILMAGGINNKITQNRDLIVTKTDNTGNVIWSKIYKSRLWGHGSGSTDYFYVQQMKEDPSTGHLYITGPNWTAGRNIIKLSLTDGSIAWSNLYQPPFGGYFDNQFGIDVSGNEVKSFGTFLSSAGGYIGCYSVNKNSGDTIKTRFLTVTDTPTSKLSFLGQEPLKKLNNGNYILSGELYGYYHVYSGDVTPLYHAGVAELDPNFNFIKAYCIRNPVSNNSNNTRVTVFPDGSGIFTMLNVYSGYTADGYYTQFNNGVIQKSRKKFYSGQGMPSENEWQKLPDGGDLSIKLVGDSITNSAKIEFLKLHATDTSSACLGIDDNNTFTQPYHIGNVNAVLDSIGVNVFLENPNKTLFAQDVVINDLLPGCQQNSICDTIHIASSTDTLCPFMELSIITHKNKLCGSKVIFTYDTSKVESFTSVNDSTYKLIFKGSWQGYIYASIGGCTIKTDSVKVTVLQSPSSVNLGTDTVICPGNNILLNAHKGFATYHWQDGSSDSTYIASTPGLYYVTVTNACGGIFSDTIQILPHAPIPFSAGPDQSICEKDTIAILASPGFVSYQWQPNYRINNTTVQNVKVYPLVDTAYTVKAELTPGCYAYDTIKIMVKHIPLINLGIDTSFCLGDSLVLNATNVFNNYQWNTGATTQKITVYNAGSYNIIATAINGCKAYDTLKVLLVYPNPIVNLGTDSVLCRGTIRMLDAGNFNYYLWNTGSINQSISITTTGYYAVTVIDNNKCKASGSINITTLVLPPKDFLANDTLICSYGTLLLDTKNIYSSYLWSNNVTNSNITITQPGKYWLYVTDRYGCKGKDSIVVGSKDCLKGLYVPTAFTPNNDLKNDNFKPFLFGNIQQYELIIFNRYGQVVFKTNDFNKGWDGNFLGTRQATGAYIWLCKYTLSGEVAVTKRGSVLLLR